MRNEPLNQTANYQLNQWETTDRILMADFNSDNAKLDGLLAARNCQFYMTSYIGTGSGSCSITFPGHPILVIVMGGHHTWFCAIQGAPEIYLRTDAVGCGVSAATWTENTLTWAENASGGEYYANGQGGVYHVMALLEVD